MDAYLHPLVATFPKDAKRTRRAVIHQEFGAGTTISILKNPRRIEDRNFRHLVTRNGFQLLDLPEAGIKDALVAGSNQRKQRLVLCRYSLCCITV